MLTLFVVGVGGDPHHLTQDVDAEVVGVDAAGVRLDHGRVELLVLPVAIGRQEQALADLLVDEDGGALVDDLRAHLRQEVALLGAHDRHDIALPVLETVAVALDESEQILLWLSREAATQRRSLGVDPLPVGGDLIGEQDVVGAGVVLGFGRARLVDQLSLRLVHRDRVAGVEEVLDAVATMGAHVVGDPLGRRHARGT